MCTSQEKRKHEAAYSHVMEQSLTRHFERERGSQTKLRLLSIWSWINVNTIPLSALVLKILNMTALLPWKGGSGEQNPYIWERTLCIQVQELMFYTDSQIMGCRMNVTSSTALLLHAPVFVYVCHAM